RNYFDTLRLSLVYVEDVIIVVPVQLSSYFFHFRVESEVELLKRSFVEVRDKALVVAFSQTNSQPHRQTHDRPHVEEEPFAFYFDRVDWFLIDFSRGTIK